MSVRQIFLPGLLCALLLLSACAGSGPRRTDFAKTPAAQAISISPTKRTDVTLATLSMLDIPYRYGGKHPGQGFDCSGLVSYVMDAAVQLKLPHSSAQLARISRPVEQQQLTAGDLVFFNTLNQPFSHVGIYIGQGKFINAPSSGGKVRIDSLANPYFAQRFEGGRTLFAQP